MFEIWRSTRARMRAHATTCSTAQQHGACPS
jgi:hypothetical protein